jgi:hypothetical protein
MILRPTVLCAALCLTFSAGCSDSVVQSSNSAPEATILAPVDGHQSDAGTPVEFLGQVADGGHSPTDVTLVWSSSIDGILLDSVADSDGRSEWSSSELSPGHHNITLVVVDLAGASGSDSIEITIADPGPDNQPPSITINSPVDGESYEVGASVPLTATVADGEDEAEELLVSWSVDETAQVLAEDLTPDPAGIASATAFLSEGIWTLRATVTDTTGETADASLSVEVTSSQTAPTAPGVGILPADPQPANDLTCFVEIPATDLEGDPLTYSFEWSVNGNPSGYSLTGALVSDLLIVPSGDTASGESWTCTVRAHDGTDEGNPGTATITLGDCNDLDGDCYPDLVFSNSHLDDDTYGIYSYIYWGGPSGPDPNFSTLLPTYGAMGNAVTDLDGDGHLDIVFANERLGPTYAVDSFIYWGSTSNYGPGNRTGLPTVGARAVKTADLDSDGYLDLIFANAYDGNNYSIDSYIYWGGPSGFGLWNRTELPTRGAEDIAIEDLNSDGYLDLVFANMFNGASYSIQSYIYWGGPSGFSESSRTELDTEGATGVAVADLDGDTELDIVFSNGIDETVGYATDSYVYWGSPAGYSNASRTDLPTRGAWGVTLADLDGDNYSEIVFSNRFEGGYYTIDSYVYWGSPSGYSVFSRSSLPTQGARDSAIADLNGDGVLDIAFANVRSGTATLAISSYVYWGTGNVSAPFSSSPAEFATIGAAGVTIAE